MGVALFNHLETSQGAILKRADSAMYQAKHGGCNQVRFCNGMVAPSRTGI
ncbi:MAG: hypothetical protein WB775_05065 [Burkholderiaceae bacterium]